MYQRFEGRWVLVTGAGTRFGATIAERAAAEGANVVVHYNSSLAGAQKTADRVRAYGRQAIVLKADLRSWEEVRTLADGAFAQSGGIDVLINNVGDIATEQMSWRGIDEAIVDRVLAVDIKGTMLMIHEFGTTPRRSLQRRATTHSCLDSCRPKAHWPMMIGTTDAERN